MVAKIFFILATPWSHLIAFARPNPRLGNFLGPNEAQPRNSKNSIAFQTPTWEVFLCAYEIGSAAGLAGYHTDIAFCPVGTPTSDIPSTAEAPEFLRTNNCIEVIWDGRNDGAIYTSVGDDAGRWPQGAEHRLKPDLTYKGQASIDLNLLAQTMRSCGIWGGDDWLDFNKDTYHLTKHNCNKFSHQVLKHLGFGGLDLKYRKEKLLDYSVLYWIGRGGLGIFASAEERQNILQIVHSPIQISEGCERELSQRNPSPERSNGCGFFC